MRKRLILLSIVLICFIPAAIFANGQEEQTGTTFPARTIENIYPWGPGSAMSVSQIVASALGEELGSSVTVISTPGAAGTKAFQTALSRPADGYTIFDGYVAPLVLQPILGKADWDYKDFKPLHSVASNPFAIACNVNETRWNTFEEMMAYGKAHPGELRYSSGFRNNLPHMVIAKVLQSYGVVAQMIPYNSGGDSDKDLKSGVLDFAYLNVGNYLQDQENYKIMLVLSESPVAKASYNNATSLADLKIDIGLSNLGPMGWTWWLVRKETPDDVTEVLRSAMDRVMEREDVKSSLVRLGFVPLEWGDEEYEEIVGSVHDQLISMGNALTWEQEELKKINK